MRDFRKIGAAPKGLAFGRQKHGQRPSALLAERMKRSHVDVIDIRPLLAINLDVHEELVHHRGGSRVLEAFMGHDMTPMAGRVADGEQNRLLQLPSLLQRHRRPHAPMHRVARVLQEIWAGRLTKFIG
jgi:hypothetical protein